MSDQILSIKTLIQQAEAHQITHPDTTLHISERTIMHSDVGPYPVQFKTFRNIRFTKCTFIDIQFEHCYLHDIMWDNCKLFNVCWNHSSLSNVAWYATEAYNTNIEDSHMQHIHAEHSLFENVTVTHTAIAEAELLSAKCISAHFGDVQIADATFDVFRWRDVAFNECHIKDSQLKDGALDYTVFASVTFLGVSFNNAPLVASDMSDIVLIDCDRVPALTVFLFTGRSQMPITYFPEAGICVTPEDKTSLAHAIAYLEGLIPNDSPYPDQLLMQIHLLEAQLQNLGPELMQPNDD